MPKFIFFIVSICLLASCSSSTKTSNSKSQKTAIWSNKKDVPAQDKGNTPPEKNKKTNTPVSVAFEEELTIPKKEPSKNKEQIENEILYAEINKWVGTPHKIGGCTTKGIDCSCFVMQIYKNVYGIELSNRSSIDMLNEIEQIDKADLKEGDIIFFKAGKSRINHVGVFLKDDKFVHSSTSRGVIISSLSEAYWKKSYATAGRHKNMK